MEGKAQKHSTLWFHTFFFQISLMYICKYDQQILEVGPAGVRDHILYEYAYV